MATDEVNLAEDFHIPESQVEFLENLKNWLKIEVEFDEKPDDKFLLLFLMSCNYDMKLVKSTIIKYYDVRKDARQWWIDHNDNVDCMKSLLNLQVACLLKNNHVDEPVVLVASLGNMGENMINVDNVFQLGSLAIDVMAKRENILKNGAILIVDYQNYNWKFVLKFVSPILLKKMLDIFYHACPFKLQKFIGLNTPYLIKKCFPMVLALLPSDFKNKVVLYDSEWPTLSEHVPLEMIPEEYGGLGGPIQNHADAARKEIFQMKDYYIRKDENGNA
ncbi:hypothetical protein CHUAL_001744 [Chamberlinius hualienensis]